MAVNLYELEKKKRKNLLFIDLNEARSCVCLINVLTSEVSLMPMFKRPKEFVFLDLDINSRHVFNNLRFLANETKAIGFVIGHHAPCSGFDPLDGSLDWQGFNAYMS